MTAKKVEHPTVDERHAVGKAAREQTPRESLEGWEPAADRPDPVALLEAQNATREPDLVPVRHGRMMVSAFTFYRGAAKIMAADLAKIPRASLAPVQLCGDAHLSNFGAFASPERVLLFDVNDFDETLPGPFEYDVARLAASLVVAARDNGFSADEARASALAVGAGYRTAVAGFAGMRTLDVWYSRAEADEIVARATVDAKKRQRKVAEKNLAKARSKDSMQALAKLTEVVDGRHRIISDPPVVIPERELAATYGMQPEEARALLSRVFRAYRQSLPDERRRLLERFEFVDFARKVVGVGSVGTRAWIALLQGRDGEDPLFLQIKEATSSVLEDHLPKSRYRQPGERVVQGQRMMQAASDIFLGWTKGVEADRFYYWRQLRDMKGSAIIENMDPEALNYYAGVCAWTLARAHARSGDAIAIAGYLGKGERFDRAMADFAVRYADQNERDYEAFVGAVRSGRLEATEGV
jgi:uncharacterized protein (DUF2252 family)